MEEERTSDQSGGVDDGLKSRVEDKPNISLNKYETLDEGTSAFMHWLNSDDKKSLTPTSNPIVLLKFVNDVHTILYDTYLRAEIDVEINKGIPYCKHCNEGDCAHVGFAICIEQLYGHRRSGTGETVEDIIEI